MQMADVGMSEGEATQQFNTWTTGTCNKFEEKPNSNSFPLQSFSRHDQFLLTRLKTLFNNGFCNLSPNRHTNLIDALASLRASVVRGVQNSRPVNVIITAYAKQPMRNLFLRTLRQATGARVIYAAYVDGDTVPARHLKQFECFISFSARPDSQLAADPDTLQHVLDAFAVGACCIDLEGVYMSSAMISALERIWKGRYPYGNFDCVKNTRFKQDFLRMCASRAELIRRQNVMAHTGFEFTSGNMLHLYFSGQNVYQTLQHTRRELMHIEANLSRYERRNPPPPPQTFLAALPVNTTHENQTSENQTPENQTPENQTPENQTTNASWQRARTETSHSGISGPFADGVIMARAAGFMPHSGNTAFHSNQQPHTTPPFDPRIEAARYATVEPALLSLNAVRSLLNSAILESDSRVFAVRQTSPSTHEFHNIIAVSAE